MIPIEDLTDVTLAIQDTDKDDEYDEDDEDNEDNEDNEDMAMFFFNVTTGQRDRWKEEDKITKAPPWWLQLFELAKHLKILHVSYYSAAAKPDARSVPQTKYSLDLQLPFENWNWQKLATTAHYA